MLDVDHSYNYGGRAPLDWESNVVLLRYVDTGHSKSEPVFVLDRHPEVNPRRVMMMAAAKSRVDPARRGWRSLRARC